MMSTIHEIQTVPDKNYLTLSQLYSGLSHDVIEYSKFAVNDLLQHGCEINYTVPDASLLSLQTPDCLGYTPLHFAVRNQNLRGLRILLNHGADFTIKSNDEFTPLRLAIETSFTQFTRCLGLKGKLKHPFVDLLLSAQIDRNNPTNPHCKNGISHFHIACMFNNTEAVKFFLNNGVSANEAINMDSPSLPGYTPLHFAARYCCLETAQILLNYGADAQLKDAQGMIPLYLLIERNMQIIEHVDLEKAVLDSKLFAAEVDENESMIFSLLEKDIVAAGGIGNFVDDIGLTKFHICCARKTNIVALIKFPKDLNINASIDLDSPIWAGYTPLHFAAHFNSSVVVHLLQNGANIAAKDANGLTPFDVCVKRFTPKDIHLILSKCQHLKYSLVCDHAELLDIVSALFNVAEFEDFLQGSTKLLLTNVNIHLSTWSPIWPGYTPLHLAVLLAKSFKNKNEFYAEVDRSLYEREHDHQIRVYRERVLLCLKRGADPTVQDANGLSPLHLAFRLQKRHIVNDILEYHKKFLYCPADGENLSYCHIICATKNQSLVKEFLHFGKITDINSPVKSGFKWYKSDNDFDVTYVKPGSTPLHISVAFESTEITKLLLENGADPLIRDADGLTPIHLAFSTSTECSDIVNLLLSVPQDKCVNYVASGGLSHFHIACFVNHLTSVKAFLKVGVDIDARITCRLTDTYADNPEAVKCSDFYTSKNDCSDQFLFLSSFAGYTPLHFAVKGYCSETVEFLIQRGANIHAKNEVGLTPLHLALMNAKDSGERILDCFVSVIDYDDTGCIDETGLTSLHIACMRFDKAAMERLLTSGADANARTDLNSPIWPGETPLHVLLKSYFICSQVLMDIISLLSEHGANVNILDAENFTPLHVAKLTYGEKNLYSGSSL